jgi:uncharacterized membrane protein
MGNKIFDRIKKILTAKKMLSIFVVPFFVASITAVVVLSLAYNMGIKFANNIFFQKRIWTINWKK